MELSINNLEHWQIIKEIEESLQYTKTKTNEENE